MHKVYLQYGYTLKDIAEYIGVHYSTVDRVIKRIEGKVKSDIARLIRRNPGRRISLA